MEPKKIAFGFSKIIKKPQLELKVIEKKKNEIELIRCLEGQKIKLIDETPKETEKPLVIPMKESSKTSAALASLQARKAVLEGTDIPIDNLQQKNKSDIEDSESVDDSLEKRAARELLREARLGLNNVEENKNSSLTLPLKADELPLEGAAEPTIDDYENIPIQQYGMAMLRGMGFKEEKKSKKDSLDLDVPAPRPKGMGLGADKAIRKQDALIPPEENEKLEIKKNAYIKILAGKYKNQYAQIEGLDEHGGRVIIKLALGGVKESLNEFLVQPVSKKEYQTYGKVINSTKYEEYLKKEKNQNQTEEKYSDKIKSESNIKDEKYVKREKDKYESSYSNLNKEDYKHKSTSSRRYSSEDDNKKNVIKKESEIKKEKDNGYRLDTKQYRDQSRSYNSRRNYSSDEDHNSNEKHTKRRSRSRDRKYESSQSKSKQRTPSESSDSSSHRHKHKSKKKSSKSKKSKKSHFRNSSSEDDKKHKKKTKKSRRSRSRSRSRGRR